MGGGGEGDNVGGGIEGGDAASAGVPGVVEHDGDVGEAVFGDAGEKADLFGAHFEGAAGEIGASAGGGVNAVLNSGEDVEGEHVWVAGALGAMAVDPELF